MKKNLFMMLMVFLSACTAGSQSPPTQTKEPIQVPQESVTATFTRTPPPTAVKLPTEAPTATQEEEHSRVTVLDTQHGPPIGKITELGWSAEGERLLVSGPEGLMIIDTARLSPQWKLDKPDYYSFIYWGDEFVVIYDDLLEYRLSSDGSLQKSVQLENLKADQYFLSPDGRYLVAVTSGSVFTIWDLENEKIVQSLELQPDFEYENEAIENVTFNQDGSTLFTGTFAGGVYRIEVERGEVQRLFPANYKPDPNVTYNIQNDCHILNANGFYLVVICGYYTPTEDGSAIARSNYAVRWVNVNEGSDTTFHFEVRNSYEHFSLSPDGTMLYMQGVGEFAMLQYLHSEIQFQSAPNCLNHSSDPFFMGPSELELLAVINSYESGELFLCDLYTGEKVIALEYDTP